MSIVVKAGPRDSTDSVIKKFQKRVIMEGVIQEYRDRQYHKTDAQKRQERRQERIRKIMRAKRLSRNDWSNQTGFKHCHVRLGQDKDFNIAVIIVGN